MERHLSRSESATIKIARNLGNSISLPAVVCLFGDLGTGKTVFARGLAGILGIPPSKIKSPTFTFQRRHSHGKYRFYHFDFYRVLAADDLIRTDLEEALADNNGLVVAEWAQNIADALPPKRIDIECRYVDEKQREFIINFVEDDGEKIEKPA